MVTETKNAIPDFTVLKEIVIEKIRQANIPLLGEALRSGDLEQVLQVIFDAGLSQEVVSNPNILNWQGTRELSLLLQILQGNLTLESASGDKRTFFYKILTNFFESLNNTRTHNHWDDLLTNSKVVKAAIARCSPSEQKIGELKNTLVKYVSQQLEQDIRSLQNMKDEDFEGNDPQEPSIEDFDSNDSDVKRKLGLYMEYDSIRKSIKSDTQLLNSLQ